MGIGEKVKKLMLEKGISAYTLSNETGISQATLSRILKKDTKPQESNLKLLSEYFNKDRSYFVGDEIETNFVREEATGYYYPEVSASAGLETEMQNDELKRIPINIPNWEKGVDFINVYGDSMYPKFCSGEIIGIKEVEPKFVNYGYAYVVILNDGQVFLKYIKKGKDEEHWLLASENPRYEPKEYHLSLIKKIFIIKGVITKTTM